MAPPTPEAFNYVYNYTDHLGNIRLSYSLNPSSIELTVMEENHYYPFGLKHSKYNSDWNMFSREESGIKLRPGRPLAPSNYKYKYNGKELQDELGLNVYDYGARNYMPDIGRYMAYDPLVEKTFEPYGYCYNNPVNVIDPTGMSGQDWVKRGKDIIFDAAITNQSEAQGKYGAEAQHLGEGATLTGTSGGETSYQYTFHKDGTITDSNGSSADAAGGFTTAGGTNIHGTDGIFSGGINDFFASLSSGSNSPMDNYRATRDNPGYNEGESKYGRIFRLMSSSHIENMLDFGGGGYNMFGGYGGATGSVSSVENSVLSAGDALRIENAATRIGTPITVVGSRASGTAGAFSDWDYVIEGLGSRNFSKIKNSLPGASSAMDNTPRNIDIFKGPVNPTKPSITINPRR